ncbi:hypothetical protein [Dechloromonas sp. A34]|uniref:hypothetical protein n=1 Tax=Dechloromonas sp. A34 TaxID=447588 RepID=UPI0022493D4A|nr:hypothetical protein [Dechloromonas sp. A34]
MNKLMTQLQRLYFLPDQPSPARQLDGGTAPASSAEEISEPTNDDLMLVSPDGLARTMVVKFERPGDWEQVAKLYQAVQDELDLPAPTLAISAHQGYRLWLSLAEPAPVALVLRFLEALRRTYLTGIPGEKLELLPASGRPSSVSPAASELLPALHTATGKWSAFIDPSLGAMFIDEPGLEMAPNMDRQAEILAGAKSIEAAEFQRALKQLETPAEPDTKAAPVASEQTTDQPGEAGRPHSTLNVGSHYSDPKSFLLAVMNDPSASAGQRIKAAKALLPYFEPIKP